MIIASQSILPFGLYCFFALQFSSLLSFFLFLSLPFSSIFLCFWCPSFSLAFFLPPPPFTSFTASASILASHRSPTLRLVGLLSLTNELWMIIISYLKLNVIYCTRIFYEILSAKQLLFWVNVRYRRWPYIPTANGTLKESESYDA